MVEFVEPPGQAEGEARRFVNELSSCWDFFASYETSAPILELTFDDGQVSAAGDLDDVPAALFSCVAHYFEFPHAGWLHAVGTVFSTKPSFDMLLAYEGTDGPLVVKFDDSTLLSAHLQPSTPDEPALTRWDAGVRAGLVHQRIEAVVSLAQVAELSAELDQADRAVVEALLDVLSRLAKTEQPPRGVVRETARWLGRKVDLFIDEAVKTGGKVAGAVAVGTAGYQVNKHMPQLAEQLRELIET